MVVEAESFHSYPHGCSHMVAYMCAAKHVHGVSGPMCSLYPCWAAILSQHRNWHSMCSHSLCIPLSCLSGWGHIPAAAELPLSNDKPLVQSYQIANMALSTLVELKWFIRPTGSNTLKCKLHVHSSHLSAAASYLYTLAHTNKWTPVYWNSKRVLAMNGVHSVLVSNYAELGSSSSLHVATCSPPLIALTSLYRVTESAHAQTFH